MTLRVVSCEPNDRQAKVTVGGETMEEVMSPAARQLAIQAGMQTGLSRAGTSGGESAYPVDSEGNTSDDLMMGRGGEVAGYHCDYVVTGGL